MKDRIITIETLMPVELTLRVIQNDAFEIVPIEVLDSTAEGLGINDIIFDEEDHQAIEDAWIESIFEDGSEDEMAFLFEADDEDVDVEELILSRYRAEDGEFYFDSNGEPIPVEDLEGYSIVDGEDI